MGPILGLGGPGVFSFGATLKLTSYLGAGVTFAMIPTMRVSIYGEAVLNYQHYDIYGRIYPFGGAFFLGAGAGYETVGGSLSKTIDVPNFGTQSVESVGSVRTLVLTPVIGLLHTFDSGFSLGLDAGVQIPIAPSEIEFETSTSGSIPPDIAEPYLEPINASVRDTLETIGRTPVPTFNLRIGWLF